MLGKTFKGMTDEMLAWQTEPVSASCRPTVRPTATNGWCTSAPGAGGRDRLRRSAAQHPLRRAALALRFARVLRYREDKTAGRGRHDRRRAALWPPTRPKAREHMTPTLR